MLDKMKEYEIRTTNWEFVNKIYYNKIDRFFFKMRNNNKERKERPILCEGKQKNNKRGVRCERKKRNKPK